MKFTKTTAVVGALLAVMATVAGAADTKEKAEKALDQAKGAITPGEVVLAGSETKTLYEGKDVNSYRVCVKPDKEAGSVTVLNDAKTTTLKPGQCEVISGMHISAKPQTALAATARSTVTFQRH
jgi:hypothetical protein